MGSSVFSVFVLVLLFSLGTELNLCASFEEKQRIFITWDDLTVEDQSGSSDLNEIYNGNGILVVDKEGKGDSITVQGAVDLVPDSNGQRVKILILPGIYREKVFVPSTKPYISFIGNYSTETVITFNSNASDEDSNGKSIGTFNSATVTIESDYFCATGITIENSAVAKPGGVGMQGVALRIYGDKSMFFRMKVLGSQDTLLDQNGTHYFYQCYIQGSIDFIFGNARSLYQECTLHSTANTFGAIAASQRDSLVEDTGFSFINCTVNGTGNIYLGRAWGIYSRVVYSYCNLDAIVTPEGWSDWGDPSRNLTVWFGEYQCLGTGANSTGRVPWSKSLSDEEAKPFLDKNFIDGDQWLRL